MLISLCAKVYWRFDKQEMFDQCDVCVCVCVCCVCERERMIELWFQDLAQTQNLSLCLSHKSIKTQKQLSEVWLWFFSLTPQGRSLTKKTKKERVRERKKKETEQVKRWKVSKVLTQQYRVFRCVYPEIRGETMWVWEQAWEGLSRCCRGDWLHLCQVTGVLSNNPPRGRDPIGCSRLEATGTGQSLEPGGQVSYMGQREGFNVTRDLDCGAI